MRFYNRLNMKKKINKVQELKSSGVQKSTHGVSKFQSSRVPESTLKPLNPLNVEPSKEGWRLARLGEVCISTENRDPRITPDLPFRYVDISSVDNRSKRIIQARTILGKDAPSRARQLIKANDLLVATTRPNLNAVALVPEELHNEICSTGFCVLRPTEVINSLFLFFFVRTKYFIDRISGSGQVRGMLYPAVTDNQVRNVYISLPPLPEQKRIAAKLQELMQEVERARTACEKQLEAAKSLPAAYLRDLFESEEAEMWDRKRLVEVREKFVNGGTPDTSVPTYWDGNIPWITGADITSFWVSGGRKFITEEGLKNSATHLVPKNTVLVVTRTGVGKVGIAANDLSFSQDITGVICGAKILPEFLARFLLFQGDTLIRIQRGATIKGLTRDDIESLKVPLPSFSIQYSTVSYLKEKMAEVEKLRISIEKQLEAINALPQTVLRKAFRGEL